MTARDPLARAERGLYLASRAAGDLRAARSGRLVQRLTRRQVRRAGFRLLRALTQPSR